MRTDLGFDILPQPDDTTCGPTCLQAVYRYYGDDVPLQDVIDGVVPLASGGTFAVRLANHALARGYRAVIHTYNLNLFDPTWFQPGVDLRAKLEAQAESKRDTRLTEATEGYRELLRRGGRVLFEDLTPSLLRRYLKRGVPILTGLSATYLYGCAREQGEKYDDIGGVPVGHFVVLCGYDRTTRHVLVADPLHDNPRFRSHYYDVDLNRLISSILLGIVTYDANLLVLEPGRTAKAHKPSATGG